MRLRFVGIAEVARLVVNSTVLSMGSCVVASLRGFDKGEVSKGNDSVTSLLAAVFAPLLLEVTAAAEVARKIVTLSLIAAVVDAIVGFVTFRVAGEVGSSKKNGNPSQDL